MALRFGLVGCGAMGRGLAKSVIESVAEAEVAAAFDPYRPNMESFCAESGAAATDSLGDLLARDDVGAVVVASPNNLHREQTAAAAGAGKHVFCEKPMALSVADCDAMIAACETAGVKLMVGHSMRLHPLPRKLLEIARSGDIGAPLFGFASYFFDGFGQRDSGIWHLDRAGSGGLFFHMAIHHIDLFLTIFGPARRVQYSGGRYGQQVRDFHDVGSGLIEFDSGATATLTASSICPVPWREMVVLFSGGFVRLDNPWSYLEYGPDDQHMTRLEPKDLPGPDALAAELTSFTRWILHDELPVFSGRDGRAAVAVAEALTLAEGTGKAVEVQR
jgi:predicted dehydrogenase